MGKGGLSDDEWWDIAFLLTVALIFILIVVVFILAIVWLL